MSDIIVTDNATTIGILQRRLNQRGEVLKVDEWGATKTREALDRHLPEIGTAGTGGTVQERFQVFLDRHGIKYFKAGEVLYRGGTDATLKINTDPPESLWPNIIPTLKILDLVRTEIGAIYLTSIYRNERYNKAVGGETNSFHTKFQAADCIPMQSSSIELHAVARRLRNEGKFKGGIGKYPSFVHIDTRGYNSDF